MVSNREGLAGRIRQMRRAAVVREATTGQATARPPDEVRSLEKRVAHLEQLVEGLQDSVHRESARHARLIAELQEQIQPAAIGEALARDARERGL